MSSSLFSLLGRSDSFRRAEGGGYIPLTDTRSRKSWWEVPQLARNGGPTYTALGLAVLAGMFICFTISALTRRPEYVLGFSSETNTEYASSIFAPPTPIYDTDNLSLEVLRSIVARSNGYWARDYSLNLGWNNVSRNHSNFQHIVTIIFRCVT